MKRFAAVALALLCGCVSGGGVHSHSAQEQGDVRVGQYRSSAWSFETSSFWIAGPDGLVLIDTQFLPSALQKELVYAKLETGQVAKLAVVLSASPDRFNGTSYLKDRDVRVVTSTRVREFIPAVHAKWMPEFFEKYRYSQYPRTLVLPDGFGDATTDLAAGGLTVRAHVLGQGSAAAHVVVEWERHLFTGDLVGNASHVWFEGGRVDEWLARIEELRALKPRWVHPGHGPSGGPELLDRQVEYLRAISAAVEAEHPRGLATLEALARIKARIEQRFPNYSHAFFLDPLLHAEWARQAAHRS